MPDELIDPTPIDAIASYAHRALLDLALTIQPDAYYSDSVVDEITMLHDAANICINAYNADNRIEACTLLLDAIRTNNTTKLTEYPFNTHPFDEYYEIDDAFSLITK